MPKGGFELPFGRQQIADILGLTIETTSRQLTRMRGEGVLDLPSRREIVINDRAAMEAMAGCGRPGCWNFVGEVSVFFGAWQVPALRVVTVLAVWGALIIGAVYMLRAVRASMHGALPEKWTSVSDATFWRKLPYAVLIASLLVFGFFPKLLTDKIKPVTEQIVNMATVKPATPVTPAAVVMVERK